MHLREWHEAATMQTGRGGFALVEQQRMKGERERERKKQDERRGERHAAFGYSENGPVPRSLRHLTSAV